MYECNSVDDKHKDGLQNLYTMVYIIEIGVGLECINELYAHKDVDDRQRDGL